MRNPQNSVKTANKTAIQLFYRNGAWISLCALQYQSFSVCQWKTDGISHICRPWFPCVWRLFPRFHRRRNEFWRDHIPDVFSSSSKETPINWIILNKFWNKVRNIILSANYARKKIVIDSISLSFLFKGSGALAIESQVISWISNIQHSISNFHRN